MHVHAGVQRFVVPVAFCADRPSQLHHVRGIILGLFLPILGIWTLASSQPAAKWIGYLLPYAYLEKGEAYIGVIWLYALLFLAASALLFQRRDF